MPASTSAADAGDLPAYAASRGHDACQIPLVRWVEPAVPASAAAPIHPNLQGMQAMANLVVAAATPSPIPPLPLPLPLGL
jgi:hypothetical protein